ncbi:hypothetical protein IWX50DRAFT_616269 [Phyllosticta citricarpa]
MPPRFTINGRPIRNLREDYRGRRRGLYRRGGRGRGLGNGVVRRGPAVQPYPLPGQLVMARPQPRNHHPPSSSHQPPSPSRQPLSSHQVPSSYYRSSSEMDSDRQLYTYRVWLLKLTNLAPSLPEAPPEELAIPATQRSSQAILPDPTSSPHIDRYNWPSFREPTSPVPDTMPPTATSSDTGRYAFEEDPRYAFPPGDNPIDQVLQHIDNQHGSNVSRFAPRLRHLTVPQAREVLRLVGYLCEEYMSLEEVRRIRGALQDYQVEQTSRERDRRVFGRRE